MDKVVRHVWSGSLDPFQSSLSVGSGVGHWLAFLELAASVFVFYAVGVRQDLTQKKFNLKRTENGNIKALSLAIHLNAQPFLDEDREANLSLFSKLLQ